MRALQRVFLPAVLTAGLFSAGCLQSKTDTSQSGKTQNKSNNEVAGKSLALGERRVSGSGGIVGVVTRRVENYHELIKKKPHLKVKEKPPAGRCCPTPISLRSVVSASASSSTTCDCIAN